MGRVIDKKTWKVIEIALQRYPEQKKKLDEMLEDIVLSKGSDSGRTNFDTEYVKPQSVTESKALKLQSGYYKKLQRNVSAIENVYRNLNQHEQDVIRLRYWKDPNRKTPYVKIDCGYSERQMKRIVFKTMYQVGVRIGEIENDKY